jgi:AAA ATPase containing von Willebrand factor type A (vWA) domain
MSEFDKENTFDSAEKNEAVEAFDDFEMSIDDTEASAESVEVFDEIEDVMAAVEAVEEVESIREDEFDQETSEEPVEDEETDEPEEPMEVDEEDEEDEELIEAVEADEEVEEVEDDEEPAEAVEAVEDEEPAEAVEEVEEDEEPIEAVEAAEEDEEPAEAVEEVEDEESAEAVEAVEDEESAETDEAVDEVEEPAEAVEAVEEVEEPAEAVEEVEDDEEPAEADEAVEDDEEPAETDEAVEEDEEPIEAVEKVEDDEEEIDIMSAVAALDACADNQYDSAEIISEEEFLSDTPEVVDDESAQTEDDSEKSEDAEESDEDDYLDYDDIPRPKKTVSGKTALITMLVTGIVTICLIVGAVILGIICKKDTGVSVISYSDKFNACDTNSFSLGQMMGAGLVSMSDAECSLSNEEITALKKGKTVTKFNKMLNLKADTRFGKIVSMDISFNSELNEQKESGITCMMLLGNAMSGFMDNIDSSDQAFLTAYKILVEGSYPAANKGDRVYVYKTDDIAVYSDYSKMTESNDFSALTVHIENKDPKYIDTEKLDFSWLPFDFSSDKNSADGKSVSGSDK